MCCDGLPARPAWGAPCPRAGGGGCLFSLVVCAPRPWGRSLPGFFRPPPEQTPGAPLAPPEGADPPKAAPLVGGGGACPPRPIRGGFIKRGGGVGPAGGV